MIQLRSMDDLDIIFTSELNDPIARHSNCVDLSNEWLRNLGSRIAILFFIPVSCRLWHRVVRPSYCFNVPPTRSHADNSCHLSLYVLKIDHPPPDDYFPVLEKLKLSNRK